MHSKTQTKTISTVNPLLSHQGAYMYLFQAHLGDLLERGGLFNLAKRITGSLSTSSSQDQELHVVGHLPIELSLLLCKFLSRKGCSLEFSLMRVMFLEDGLVVPGCYTAFKTTRRWYQFSIKS